MGEPVNDRKPRVIAMDIAGRVPPHNAEAEAAVLSAVLTSRGALDDVAEMLPNAEPFYVDQHRRIFEAARAVHETGSPVDLQTIYAHLRTHGQVQAIGGLEGLSKIIDASPAVAHVEAHAKIVRESWLVRRLIDVCKMIAAEGHTDYGDARRLIDDAEAQVFAIASLGKETKKGVWLFDLVAQEIARQSRIEAGEAASPGVPTGFTKIDEATGGLRRGETWIVGGRPGSGKTSMMLSIQRNVAGTEQDGKKLGCYGQSIEMTNEQIPRRHIAMEAGVSVLRATKGKMSASERAAYYSAAATLSSLPIVIDDDSHVTPSLLRAKVRRVKSEMRKRGVDLFLVWVDYVQRMKPDAEQKGRTREREIAECMTACAEVAKDMDVVMVVGAQLSRANEYRVGEKGKSKVALPRLADLRESGQLEQDAQQILLLHRPEYYLREAGEDVPDELKGVCQVVRAKVRDGETGVDELHFDGYCTRFTNAEEKAPAPKRPPPSKPSRPAEMPDDDYFGPINQ